MVNITIEVDSFWENCKNRWELLSNGFFVAVMVFGTFCGVFRKGFYTLKPIYARGGL
jgi:hypothetical protein